MFSYLINKMKYYALVLILGCISKKNKIKNFFIPVSIKQYLPFKKHSAAAIVAIYEKQKLREDIKNLIQSLKKNNIYVIVINTQKLNHSEVDIFIKQHVDVYIERFNYGQCFGSYQIGIQLLQKKGTYNKIEKLFIMNDSVFYIPHLIEKIIKQVLVSQKNLIALTQNFEYQLHYSSYFLCFGETLLKNSKFLKFWKCYQNSGLRNKVIRNGELKLSKTILQVTHPDDIFCFFDYRILTNFISKSKSQFDAIFFVDHLIRDCGNVRWKKTNLTDYFAEFTTKFNIDSLYSSNKLTDRSDSIPEAKFIMDEKFLKNYFNKEGLSKFIAYVKDQMVDQFNEASQVHKNNLFLVSQGFPLVKLDLIYRGVYNYSDLVKFKLFLKLSDYKLLEKLLMSRAYGGQNLFGWQRYAFNNGII